MASKEFVENFNTFVQWFGFWPDEIESLKTTLRGNMDAADTFLALVASRIRQDPRYGTTERIRASIAAERENERKTEDAGA